VAGFGEDATQVSLHLGHVAFDLIKSILALS
jgi:hypothetical protein